MDGRSRNICRGGIIPSLGNKIMEIDYSGIEVKGMAVCSHDPILIREAEDPEGGSGYSYAEFPDVSGAH